MRKINMGKTYQKIIAAVDGSYESELAVEKAIDISLRNHAELLLVHIIDTYAYQEEVVYNNFAEQVEHSDDVLKYYLQIAKDKGLTNVRYLTEIGSPKTLLTKEIPVKEKADLIIVGATGMNTFERLLLGSTSEYILRHSKIDMLIVRNKD